MLLYMAGLPAIFGRQMPWFLDPVFISRAQIDPPNTEEGEQKKIQVELPKQKEADNACPSSPDVGEETEGQPCAVPSE